MLTDYSIQLDRHGWMLTLLH